MLALVKRIRKPHEVNKKILMTSVGIEPTTSGLDIPLLCQLSYEVGQRKPGTIKVVNRGGKKICLHKNVNRPRLSLSDLAA